MFTPGAHTPGAFAFELPNFGPRLEKSAQASLISVAPTLNTFELLAGYPVVPQPGPELPFAKTGATLKDLQVSIYVS